MGQETTNLTVIEIPAHLREVVMHDNSSSSLRAKTCGRDEGSITIVRGKEGCNAEQLFKSSKEISRKAKRSSTRTSKKKGNIQNPVIHKSLIKAKDSVSNCTSVPMKTRQLNQVNMNAKGLLNINTTGEKVNMGTSSMIIDHFATQSGDVQKHVRETIRTSGKIQNNGADASWSLKTAAPNTKSARPARIQSSLRHFKKNVISKPKVRGRSAPVTISYKDFSGDKAENNNWMIDSEKSSDVKNALAVPTFHIKSRASSFSAFIQPNTASKTVFRAVSSDHSSGFSTQNSNSSATKQHDNQLKGNLNLGLLEVKPTGSIGDSKLMSVNRELYNSCANESLKCEGAFFTNGRGQTRPDWIRTCQLDELRAYAKSIANCVKKILLLSPVLEQSEEIIENVSPIIEAEVDIQIAPQVEEIGNKSSPDVALHRYMTEINMTNIPETRSKALLNKSVSYDGRVGTCMDEKEGRSPMYWLSQDKDKISESKLSDPNTPYVDVDYFASGKDGKNFLANDGDKNKISRADKLKPRISTKQLARVERARTDGDLRINPQANILSKKIGKDEQRKGYEFQRNRSKTFHELDESLDELDELSETNNDSHVIVCRQKVIHEGSPVDPPYNFEIKKCEDNRGRKAMFIRSATAPYKNHVSKKDITTADKLSLLESISKTNKPNLKVTVRTNKASTLRKENSLNDKKKVYELFEPEEESWKNDVLVMSFNRRRSTSCDGRRQSNHKRDDLHRSMSWSVVDSDDEGSKQRITAASISNMAIKRQKEQGGRLPFNTLAPSKLSERTQNQQEINTLNGNVFLYDSDTFMYNAQEPTNETVVYETSKDISLSDTIEHVEQKQSHKKSCYFNNRKYYNEEKQLSPCIEEDILAKEYCDTPVDIESYYCYTETANMTNQLVDDGVKTGVYNERSFYKDIKDEAYSDKINKYEESDNSLGKNNPWYSPSEDTTYEQKAVVRRDRSLESKSSTSFHLVTRAKSSHSDEALIKYSAACEHSSSRKHTMYTESDVDTGIIYHLAKRQTTRAHVLPYHDITRVSRDIYTMSGDVSLSTSSNSTFSTKSEISECVYTGGFYQDDTFYKNECKYIRNISSVESSSQIYFEPDGISKSVTSELDIYTGSIFNSNQNTNVIPQDMDNVETNVPTEALNGRNTDNLTRLAIGRTQRRIKYRPRIDAITVRNNDSTWNCMCKNILSYSENNFYNVSNNSNNWCAIDEFDGAFNQGSIVTKSKEPLYTDYDPGMRPEFHVRTIEKTGPVFDFLKYESTSETNASFFSSPQIDNASGDSTWYSGMLNGQNIDNFEKGYKRIDQSPDGSMFSWQYSDDYYTSTVRPRIKVNKYGYGKQGKITRDTNNNHFDDIYTGSYGAQNVQPRVQEQPSSSSSSGGSNIQHASESWYVKQPTPKLTSTTFFEPSYDSVYTDSARKSNSAIYDSVKDSRSSTIIFGKETASYSGSSTYMVDDSYRKYEQTQRQTLDEPQKPHRLSADKSAQEETESYFNYISNKSSDRGFYIGDDDTYSFEEKIVKEVPEVPVIQEVKTVGGIVCRENVANKEDYAEDINRDLEPGPWTPFSFRRDDEIRHPIETSGGHEKSEIMRASEAISQGQIKNFEDTSYAHNRIYDNIGARNKWREMAGKKENEEGVRSKDISQHRSYQAGDTGKQDHSKSARSSPDIIPDRARGKRTVPNTSKSPGAESSSSSKSTGSIHHGTPTIMGLSNYPVCSYVRTVLNVPPSFVNEQSEEFIQNNSERCVFQQSKKPYHPDIIEMEVHIL